MMARATRIDPNDSTSRSREDKAPWLSRRHEDDCEPMVSDADLTARTLHMNSNNHKIIIKYYDYDYYICSHHIRSRRVRSLRMVMLMEFSFTQLLRGAQANDMENILLI